MIKIGVVGYGYWGPNIVRNFMEADNAVVKSVSDLNPARQKLAKTRYPIIETMDEPARILTWPCALCRRESMSCWKNR